MTRPLLRLILLATAVLLLSACGGSKPTPKATATVIENIRVLETIEIHESEFRLDPATTRLERRAYYGIKAINDGEVPHALEITGPGLHRSIGEIAPGESRTFAVFFRQRGTYRLTCPLDDHAGQGMRATITVGSA